MLIASDYYAELGVTRDAAPEEIRYAYHLAVRRLHPDVNQEPGETELFLKIQEAYSTLSDPQKREVYNSTLPPPPINLSVLYSRSSLPPISQPQVVYILLDLSAPVASNSQSSPPVNLCLVLDRSTSMKGERMDMVKRTAMELVRQLRVEDLLSIVVFSDRAEVLLPASGRLQKKEAETRIQMIHTGGGTEIFHGLEAGYYEVRRNFSRSYVNQILLLTDGCTYGDEPACEQIAAQAGSLGIGISCLGIGSDWNDVFLDRLAAQTGGTSMYVSKPDEIKQFLIQKVSSLGQVYAERVALELELEAGVELRDAFRLTPDASRLSMQPPIRTGSVHQNGGHKILLEFKLPELSQKASYYPLAAGRISFDIPSRSASAIQIPLRLACKVKDKLEADFIPPVLLKALSHLNLYRMHERAHQKLAGGDVEGATRHLQNLATHLFSRGERELARTVLEEAEKIKASQVFSEEGKKRIKYGTRSLIPSSSTAGSESTLPWKTLPEGKER